MGKTRQKNHSEIEYLKGLLKQHLEKIRKLEKENDKLRKNKKDKNIQETLQEYNCTQKTYSNDKCPNCGKSLKMLKFPKVTLFSCKDCGYKRSDKGENEENN